jgi:ABC-2 type transport system permease protein
MTSTTSTAPASNAPVGSVVSLALHQFPYDLRSWFRNRQSRFFTVILPITFLVILAGVFGGSTNGKVNQVDVAGGKIDTSVYYVPGIITLGLIANSLVNLVISVTAQRESGVLKRRRATPVPAAAVIAGRALTAVVTSLVMSGILLVLGWLFYHAHLPARTAPALVITVILGSLAFCCIGYALASIITDEDAAQPVVQAVMLPLYFISGVLIPSSQLPTWLSDIANVFPVRHMVGALLAAYNPNYTGAGFAGTDLLIVAAWAVAALAFALRRFSWLPKGG